MNKKNLHTIFSYSECLSEEKILAYCNNQLTNKERNEVERHTINCKFCSDALEGFEKQVQSQKNYYEVKSSFTKKEKRRPPFYITLTGLAAACLAFVFLLNELNKTREEIAVQKPLLEKTEKQDAENFQWASDSKANGNSINLKDSNLATNYSYSIEYNDSSIINSFACSKPDSKEVYKDKEQNKLLNISPGGVDNNNKLSYNGEVSEISGRKRESTNSVQWTDSLDDYMAVKLNSTTEIQDSIDTEKKYSLKEGGGTNTILEEEVIDLENEDDFDSIHYTINGLTASKPNNAINLSEGKKDSSDNLLSLNYEHDKVLKNRLYDANKLKFSKDSILQNNDFDLGLLQFNKKLYKSAISHFLNISPNETNYYECQLYIGKSYIQLNDSKKAKPFLQNAIKGGEKIKKEAEDLLKTIK